MRGLLVFTLMLAGCATGTSATSCRPDELVNQGTWGAPAVLVMKDGTAYRASLSSSGGISGVRPQPTCHLERDDQADRTCTVGGPVSPTAPLCYVFQF